MTGDKHGWNRLKDHITIMLNAVEQFSFFIEYDDLDRFLRESYRTEFPGGGTLLLAGEIVCQGGIIISYHKLLELRVADSVLYSRTASYSYNERYKDGDRFLFRYDCADAHTYQHLPTAHHKHESAIYRGTGDTYGQNDHIFHVGEDWPHLSEVLEEAWTWYQRHAAT